MPVADASQTASFNRASLLPHIPLSMDFLKRFAVIYRQAHERGSSRCMSSAEKEWSL